MGTTARQLAVFMSHHLGRKFLGVFSSDTLPHYDQITPDSCLIANMSPEKDPGTHWVALLHLNNRKRPPEFFDSYALGDQLDSLLDVHTHFNHYLEEGSKKWGHHGTFYFNRIELQDVRDPHGGPSDTCGEWCCFALLHQCLPQDPRSQHINPAWEKAGLVNLNKLATEGDQRIKKIIQLRR